MKRFVFPLERIRAWNATRLRLEETEIESILERQRRAEAAYAEVCAQRVEFEHHTLRQRLIESGELARIEQFRQFVASEGKRTQGMLADFARQIAGRRVRIVELKRKIELLDRLRKRQQEAWTAEETKELQTAADEAFRQRLTAKRR
jgi:hypothetical protein